MSLDGGFIYSAGRCGLVPVLAENQSEWSWSLSGCGEEWALTGPGVGGGRTCGHLWVGLWAGKAQKGSSA